MEEVALKLVKVSGPVNTPAPVTESGVPGVEVPIPRRPLPVSYESATAESSVVAAE